MDTLQNNQTIQFDSVQLITLSHIAGKQICLLLRRRQHNRERLVDVDHIFSCEEKLLLSATRTRGRKICTRKKTTRHYCTRNPVRARADLQTGNALDMKTLLPLLAPIVDIGEHKPHDEHRWGGWFGGGSWRGRWSLCDFEDMSEEGI
jgi:hypothetical protein